MLDSEDWPDVRDSTCKYSFVFQSLIGMVIIIKRLLSLEVMTCRKRAATRYTREIGPTPSGSIARGVRRSKAVLKSRTQVINQPSGTNFPSAKNQRISKSVLNTDIRRINQPSRSNFPLANDQNAPIPVKITAKYRRTAKKDKH